MKLLEEWEKKKIEIRIEKLIQPELEKRVKSWFS